MYQSIITFDCQAFDTEERLRPVFDLIEGWSGFRPTHYDLNQMEQWRAWDDERAFVDALTQRTQLVRIRGEEGALVMIAMGKHGEPPTIVFQIDAPDAETATQPWEFIDEALVVGASLVRDGEELRTL